MNIYKKILYTAGATLLLSTATHAADLSAKQIMQNALKFIQDKQKYAFEAVIIDEVKNGEETTKFRNDVAIKVERPDSLRIDRLMDGVHKTYYIDNGQFTMIDHQHNFYAQVETPKTLDGALDFIFKKYDISAPLSALIYSSMKGRSNLKNSKNFGIRTLGGVECNYVAFAGKSRQVHVWIATGEEPLIKAFSVVDTTLKDHPRTNTTIVWKLNTEVSDSDFVFEAPKDATMITIDNKN